MRYEILNTTMTACASGAYGAQWWFEVPPGYKLFNIISMDTKKGTATVVVFQGSNAVQTPIA